MYSKEDVSKIVEYIKTHDLKKIYVTGCIGSGKSSFAKEISDILGFGNIDLDSYFRPFCEEMGRNPETQGEILDFALQKNAPPFVVNHADILRQDLAKEADLVVLLNPSKEDLLRVRKEREESGVVGGWRNIGEEKYDKMIEENISCFERLQGDIVYNNGLSGTIAKVIKR